MGFNSGFKGLTTEREHKVTHLLTYNLGQIKCVISLGEVVSAKLIFPWIYKNFPVSSKYQQIYAYLTKSPLN